MVLRGLPWCEERVWWLAPANVAVRARRPLKVGIVLPYFEGGMGGATPRWADILALARRAEELGFDSAWVPDHLLFRFLDGGPIGPWEGWSLVAALAAATARLELGPLIACTAFRNPALLAKMADTVDEVSGGRLILGLGAGYHEPEYRAFGYPYDHRAARFEEALAIIGPLLREGRVDFAGRFYQAHDCELRPRGPRPGGPPLLIAGFGPRLLRLAARHADLTNDWLPFRIEGTGDRLVPRRNHPDEVAPTRAALDAACAAAGRDPATLARTAAVAVEPLREAATLSAWQGRGAAPLAGTPAVLAEAMRGFARAGIAHVQLVLHPNTLAGLEAFAPTLGLLDRDAPPGEALSVGPQRGPGQPG
jgi:alkanesulfonate monooxygenase SsuD/methylene tetrahydromethanopterin reductase-like flavin-dependent oxidoreductase (luciferase family)